MKGIILIIGIILLTVFLIMGIRIYQQNNEISEIEKAVITDNVVVEENNQLEIGGELVTLTKTTTGLKSEGLIDINTDESYLRFTGYGPGKSHIGSFESLTAELLFNDKSVVGGQMIIEASSIKTDNDGLDKHLNSDDFLDTENHSQILFVMNEIVTSDADQTSIVNGTLEIKGIKKNITVPLTILSNGFYTDFTIDSSLFDISYTGVNNEVRVESQILWN